LTHYKDSPSLLITNVFPEYNLLPWKFTTCPKDFWNKVENQKTFFDWAAQELGVKEYNDWYKVDVKVKERLSQNSKLQGFSGPCR
jgi:hypothetical protein